MSDEQREQFLTALAKRYCLPTKCLDEIRDELTRREPPAANSQWCVGPGQPGWYWWKSNPDAEPEVVRVSDKGMARLAGMSERHWTNLPGKWQGPIRPDSAASPPADVAVLRARVAELEQEVARLRASNARMADGLVKSALIHGCGMVPAEESHGSE